MAGAGAESLASGEDLREPLDVDSMVMLSIVTAIHECIDIAEADCPKLFTLDGGGGIPGGESGLGSRRESEATAEPACPSGTR